MQSGREIELFNLARSFTRFKLYLVSGFNPSWWYAVLVENLRFILDNSIEAIVRISIRSVFSQNEAFLVRACAQGNSEHRWSGLLLRGNPGRL